MQKCNPKPVYTPTLRRGKQGGGGRGREEKKEAMAAHTQVPNRLCKCIPKL